MLTIMAVIDPATTLNWGQWLVMGGNKYNKQCAAHNRLIYFVVLQPPSYHVVVPFETKPVHPTPAATACATVIGCTNTTARNAPRATNITGSMAKRSFSFSPNLLSTSERP